MTASTRSLKELFLAALEIAPADRQSWLAREIPADAGLREQVALLLAAHEAPQSLLDRPREPLVGLQRLQNDGPTVDPPVTERPGTQIGPYKLIEQIGEGGMGTVWMAQQSEPVKRLVALKLIKAGMDSRQVIARFEAERQALALMDHPNIARVLDGGTTNAGRPYFVMDLVRGVPITRYCDEHHLTPRQRLEMFIPICQAIQHAHQKGIIHRDLKPSNVLVALYDGKPVPRVIDFGVAKAAGQPLTEQTLVTGFGNIVGTLEYMSPEQAEINQLDIDTRSDVYSLGVLLYELLAGSPPFSRKELEQAGMLEMLRVIREQEPSKPSTKLSSSDALPTLSANRGTEPAKLTKLVRGELDWIVMKALEKDRSRRYETANGFAIDVQRYLDDEPVQACPPSMGYRLRKFARRNKRALLTASVIGVALLFAVGSLGWVVRDWEGRRVRTASEVNRFLLRAESLYDENKLPEAVAEVQKAQGVLEAGSADKELKRRVRQWLTDLDMAAKLEELMLASYDLEDRDQLYANHAQAFRDYGIDVEALPAEEAAARVADSQIKVNLADALGGLASWLQFDRRAQDPARWRRLRTIARAADPDPRRPRLQAAVEAKDVQTLRELANGADAGRLRTGTLAYLGDSLRAAGDPAAAVAFLRRVQRQHPGDFSINSSLAFCLGELQPPPLNEVIEFRRLALAARPQSAWAHFTLGEALRRKNRLDDAIIELREAVHLRPAFAAALNSLGLALHGQKKDDEAIANYKHAIGIDAKYVPALNNLGRVFRDQKKLDEAIACCKQAINIDPRTWYGHYTLGLVLHDQKKLDDAVAEYQKAIEIGSDYAFAHHDLGLILHDQEKLDEAVTEYKKAIEIDPKDAIAYVSLGITLHDQKKFDDAVTAYKKAIEIDPKDAKAHLNLGNTLHAQKRLELAVAEFKTAIEIDPNYARAHNALGIALYGQKKLNEAVAEYQNAIEIDPEHVEAHFGLGNALLDQKKLDEAAAEYRQVILLRPDHKGAYNGLGNVLYKQDKLSDAIAEYQKAIAIDPKFAGAHNNLGTVLHVQKKLDDAVAEYLTAIDIDPNDAELHYGLGNVLKDQGKLKEAIDSCKKALAIDPKYAHAYNVIGVALRRQNKLGAAVAEYHRAITLDPKVSDFHYNLGIALQALNRLDEAAAEYREAIALGRKAAGTYLMLGDALAAQNNLEDAIAAYRDAIRIQPDYAFAHNQLGQVFMRQGKLRDAIACFREAIGWKPDYALAHFNLGYALRGQGKLDDAIAAFREAIKHGPNFAIAYNNLGAILCDDLQEYDQAIECFRKAIDIEPKHGSAHYNLGNALRNQKKFDLAAAAYRKTIEVDPSDAAAPVALGDMLREQGKLDEAITAYGGVIPVKPDYAAAHYGVGLARSAQSRWVEAKSAFQESIRNQADFYEAHRDLALLLTACPDLKLRDPRQAVELAKQATELDPQSCEAWQVLGWAQCRAGDWRGSIEALEQSCKLQPGGTGDRGQWIVLALAHAKLAAQEGLPVKERQQHRADARRWFEQADKSIDSQWRVRPGHVAGQAIWDFREEAREWMAAKENNQ